MDEISAQKELQSAAGQGLDGAALDSLNELLHTVEILVGYLNDQVVQDLSKVLSPIFGLVGAIAATDLVDIMERGLQDPGLDKALLDPPKVGLIGLLKAIGDEDVQRGMGIMVALLRAIGRASRDQ